MTMKNKILFVIMVLGFAGLIITQSCKKEAPVGYTEFHVFSTPVAAAPADGATINITGTTVDLTWESSNPDGTASSANVYFGTSETPPLYAAGVKTLSINVPVELGLTYFWSVTITDINAETVASPVFSFTVFEPIGIFVGDFNADEPAEAYSYGVSFAKTSPTTLLTRNYWNSAWDATFTLDFTANTYSMPLTVWGTYSGIESGTIDPATGTMVGNYIIYHNGVNIEEGVHTYTKL